MDNDNTRIPRRKVMQSAASGALLLAAIPFSEAWAQAKPGSAVVTIMAQLRAKPGQEAMLHDALVDIVTASRRENGCITFDMHVSRDDSALFLAFERWADDAAIQAHFETPHFKAIAARLGELLVEPMQAHFARQIA